MIETSMATIYGLDPWLMIEATWQYTIIYPQVNRSVSGDYP